MRTRYVKSAEEITRLQQVYATPAFLSIRALAITFETDPEVLRELVPAPLVPAAEPIVSVSVYSVGRSNCVGPFDGGSVNLPCTYEGRPGSYCLTMPMSTDVAVTFGRELYAEPKKLAAIRLEERGHSVRGTVTRFGIPYIEINGVFTDEAETMERESISENYYFKYLPAADGRGLAQDPQLVRVTHRGVTYSVRRGTGTLTFRESPHDPVIDLPVLSAGGATLSEVETHTTAEVVATVPQAQFLPYAYGKIDDLLVWAGELVGSQ